MRRFARVAMPNIHGTALEYCAEHLLIHLDDTSTEIQAAVFSTISALASFDESAAATLSGKIVGVRASHRNPSLCNKLLEKINKVE